ncbi:hypothetical protein ElyMa_005303700 [Elysia marginata]|uniref:G-protein coupled receptors family 1 profile domain-containing protein n=1 Tax=Elysia marginata TaxID=1093978 RepID=A0AAV4JYI1_9GAST|nr:hypothetical protein ElyMa_005303700 [Elysia marginata]
MVTCVALLTYKLYESSKVRSQPRNARSSEEPSSKSADTKATQSHKLSPKDLKVVQSVVLVVTIFIVAQLPSLTYTAVRVANSEFHGRGRLVFLASIFIKIGYTFNILNASVNIFVYYN